MSERCTVKCPNQDPEHCALPGALLKGCRKTTEIGMSFTKQGKCPGCGGNELLHSYEGTYDDPDDMMCKGCIDEYHDRCREAQDAMNEPVDTDEATELDAETEAWEQGEEEIY